MRSGLSICRVTHALYPDVVGGHAIFCSDLSARQAKLGHHIHLFTARRDDLPRDGRTRDGYRITRLDSVWMPWDSLGMANPVTPTLYGAVAQARWDLVDAHAQLFWTTALSVKAALDAGRPVVITVHGVLALRDWLTNISQKLYLLSVGSWALRHCSRVVCLTKSDAEQIVSLGVTKPKIRVIPIAIDPIAYRSRKVKSDLIVWAGRMVPEKGLEVLLEAVAITRRKKKLRLLLVGDGPIRNKLIALSNRLHITGSVTFVDNLPRSEVSRVLGGAGIFVLPSLKEGLPMTLLEAMASSNAIVASKLASIEETLGDAGLYFPPGNPVELADTLIRAMSDPELRRQKGRASREIVEERFSWDTVLPQLEDLYRELVAQ